MDARKLIFILIGIICVISIIFAIYSELYYIAPTNTTSQNTINQNINSNKIDEQELINNFSYIFDNKLNYQNNDISKITKKDFNKDLVYTSYEINEQVPNKYNINAKIPSININNNTISSINNEIDSTFKNQISSIIANSNTSYNQLYDVEYMSYINSNILSLVIKATLKNGNSAQRVLVKTYNYNLSTNEELQLEEILNLKGVSKTFANKKIKETITKANVSSQSLKDLGYSVYIRDLTSDIYKIENTTTFFLGENGILYILYPYGNSNMTSEMDIIIF